MTETLVYVFGACFAIWGAGYGCGMVVGFVRKLRNAAV